jgi:hypothetical protein
MAIEAKRGCGFRKVGGLYLVSGKLGAPCGRLPFPLTRCACCGAGFKFARSWQWVDPAAVFATPPHVDGEPIPTLPACAGAVCTVYAGCPLGNPRTLGARAGLLWIGKQHYPTPAHFTAEARTLGVSRRIKSVPRGFVAGETWVLLAHVEAAHGRQRLGDLDPAPLPGVDPDGLVDIRLPGLFSIFQPTGIEKIVTETEARDADAMAALEARGITPVAVPDDDPDHR